MPCACGKKLSAGLHLILIMIFYFESSNGCEPDEDCFREFSFTHCVNVNSNSLSGPNLFVDKNTSLVTCHEKCQKDSDCDHAVYFSQVRNCFGRNNKSQSGWPINKKAHIIPKTCVPGCSMDAMDFPGNDLDYPIQNVANHLDCQQHCQAKPDCVGSTWLRPWNWFLPKACFFKTSTLLKNLKLELGAVFMPKYCLQDHRLHEDLFFFQNSRYKFISQETTYNNAMEICQDSDGTLVSLETKEEYSFIRSAVLQLSVYNSSTFSGNYWIGLTYNISQWIWVSGLPFDETDFEVWCNNYFNVEGEHSMLDTEGLCLTPKIDSERVENFICEYQGCLEEELHVDPYSNQEIDRNNSNVRYSKCFS